MKYNNFETKKIKNLNKFLEKNNLFSQLKWI